MNRIISDNTFEMNMCQLALNQVYIKDGWAWYRNSPEDELSVCDLIRRAAETLDVELPVLGDYGLSDLMVDWLQYGTEEPEGVLAILYRVLWAMAEVRARLATYENTGLEPEDVTNLMSSHGMAIDKLAEYRMREEKKAPKCYSPDIGGECRYLVPDGDDEPIDKCKRCSLCHVDKHRHQSPPNTPLTLAELRKMDGEPVWDNSLKTWGLVVGDHILYRNGEKLRICGNAYRRKPEEVIP